MYNTYMTDPISPEQREVTPKQIAMSMALGSLLPEDREPHEIHGYYFDYLEDDGDYASGAALVIQWVALEDDNITKAPPVHVYEYTEHMMGAVGRDMSMLPEVNTILFESIQLLHRYRRG